MEVKENKNYNVNSMLGVDDLEVTRALKIPDEHAYRPGINDAATAKIRENNFSATKKRMLDEGHSLQAAEKEANKIAKQGENHAKREIERVIKARGY